MLKITKTQTEQDKAKQDITGLRPEIMRNLIAATSLVILLKLDSNRCFFSPCDFEMWWMISKNNRAPLLYYIQLCASFQIHRWTQTRLTVRKRSIPVESGDFLSRVTLKFDGCPSKNKREPLLYYIKLCASFQIHRCTQTRVTVRKRPIRVKIGDFFVVYGTKKTKGHLICVASSFVHHFIAISEFKLMLESGNAQFGSKSAIFFVPCDLAIWRMT